MAAWLPAVGLGVVVAGAGAGTVVGWALDDRAGDKARLALGGPARGE